MGFEVIIKFWVISIIIMVAYSSRPLEEYSEEPDKVPCYYIFGDSLADNGNNNYIQTIAKVNYKPYGIDFPNGPTPTGRFTNGRTTVDVISELLGFKDYIPSYANATDDDLYFRLNYASGSAGILNETGKQLGERIPFDKQLDNHRSVMLRLVKKYRWRDERAIRYKLGKCLYTVGLGNNDYINNYFVPNYYNTSQKYTLNQFTQLLIQQYTRQIKRLYSYGAKKIAIFGLGSLGCTPYAISTYGNGSACVEIMEQASILFNSLLIPLVDQLNQNFSDATFTYINYYGIGQTASGIGFTNASLGCCPVASDGQCIPDGITCGNRTAYVFWDSFHPTEILNKFIAERSYQALYSTDAHPYDIQTLLLPDNEQISAV